MTGFVFTFSLLCTAALQADPALLQRPEAAILRPLLVAALPASQLTAVGTTGTTPVQSTCAVIVTPADAPAGQQALASRPLHRLARRAPGTFLRPIRAPAHRG